MGTPHLRWRLMHQSLRPCVMDVMRRWPASGIHRTVSIAASAASLHDVADVSKTLLYASKSWTGKPLDGVPA